MQTTVIQTQSEISEKALKVIALVKQTVANSITGVSFFSIKNYYSKTSGEISNYVINLGIRYESSKAKDLAFLQNLNLDTIDLKKAKLTSPLELLKEAKIELIVGFISPDENRSNGQLNAYTPIYPGIKVHNTTGFLYVHGYLVKKTVVIPSTEPKKTVNSKPITIAKNQLRSLLKTTKYVNFALEVGNTLTSKGNTIEL
jgi:hypothetical protein